MNYIFNFFIKFCLMFTVTHISYFFFNLFDQNANTFNAIFLECSGLAIIFTVLLSLLDLLSYKIKILASNHFIWIQYLILSITIILWARYFNWGDWSNTSYILVFLISFTIIYFLIYLLIDKFNRQQDSEMNSQIKKYRIEE